MAIWPIDFFRETNKAGPREQKGKLFKGLRPVEVLPLCSSLLAAPACSLILDRLCECARRGVCAGISTVHMGIGNVRRSRGIIRTPLRALSSAGCMLIAMKTYTQPHYDAHTSPCRCSSVHCYAQVQVAEDLTRYLC